MQIYMEKFDENNKRRMYQYDISGNRVDFKHGVIGGVLQEDSRVFEEGKNIGRSNEKTPEQCCIEDTVTRARKKMESGWNVVRGMELIEKNTSKTVNEADLNVPKPMLANTLEKHKKKLLGLKKIWLQPKLDGNRCICDVTQEKLYSRSRKEIPQFPEIADATNQAFFDIDLDERWADGELYSHRLTFNDMQRAIRRTKNLDKPGARELRAKIKNYIFDLVLDIPWVERLELMGKIIENDRVCVVPTIEIDVEGKSIDDIMLIIDKYKQEFIEMGYEGIMIRLGDDGYQQKRSMSLLKYKDFFDEEYKVIGFDSQEHDGTKLGAVTLRFPGPGNLEFNARPAMPESEKDHIWNNADEYLNRMATVKFQEKDAQSGIPRFPVLTKFRLKDDMS